MDDIIDFNCCRVCLARNKLIDIFEYDGELQIRDKVMYCAAVQIIKNDLLPTKICRTCKFYVDIAYIFKTVCEATHRKLIDFIRNKDVFPAPEINSEEPLAMDLSCDSKANDEQCAEEEADVLVPEKIVEHIFEDHVETSEVDLNNEEDTGDTRIFDEEFIQEVEIDHSNINEECITLPMNQPSTKNDNTDCLENKANISEFSNKDNTSDLSSKENDMLDNGKKNSVGRHVAKKNAGPHPRKLCQINSEDKTAFRRETFDHSYDERLIYDHEIPTNTNEEVIIEQHLKKDINDSPNSGRKSLRKKKKKTYTEHISQKEGKNVKSFKISNKILKQKNKLKSKAEIKGEHLCKVCKKTFPYYSHLKRHLITHSDVKQFKCSYCSSSFRNNYNLTVHLKRHTGDFQLRCDVCGKGFVSPSVLKRHMVTHTGEQQYQCQYCDKMFAHKASLKVHEHMHVYTPSYSCKICKKKFSYSNTLAEHMKSHLGIKNHKCNLCFRAFTRKTILVRHMKSCQTKRYKCKVCAFLILGINYEVHLKTHGIHKCLLCNLEFENANLLSSHNDKKHQEKFVCVHCNKKCVNKNAYDKHNAKHQNCN